MLDVAELMFVHFICAPVVEIKLLFLMRVSYPKIRPCSKADRMGNIFHPADWFWIFVGWICLKLSTILRYGSHNNTIAWAYKVE